MRPINRGQCPRDINNIPVLFKRYQDARPELIIRLGEYCSYCEMHLDACLAVEHVQPKTPKGITAVGKQLRLDWNNFLLACTNCNSTKSNKNITLSDYLWPDKDNTFYYFSYSEGGLISVRPNLTRINKKKANCIIALVGLDCIPQNNPTASDRRWNNRREAWDIATRAKNRLASNDTYELRAQIVDTVIAKGYWSIWMTVFEDDLDMRRRILDSLPGTARNCFDPTTLKPIKRKKLK